MRSNSTPSTTPTSSKTSSSKDSAYAQVAATLLELGVTVACGYIASKMLTSYLMPLLQAEGDMDSAALGSAESRLLKILERQGKGHDSSSLALTNYERQIAQDVIDPKDILTQFGDIGGIDEMKQELWELAVLPLQRPDLFGTSHLLQSPKGILLYGPPGTGKNIIVS
jgi:SpoVK/Ycf46/Vps4 family AAA+-type ATPase